MLSLFLILLLAVFLYKTIIFILGLYINRNDIADISWGTSFILITFIVFVYTKNYSQVFALVFLLVLIWGTRLAVRIFLRNRNRKEDFRYKALKNEKTDKASSLRVYLQVYILQGVLAIVVCFPIIFLGFTDSQINIYTIIGLAVWVIGFLFESIGDSELDRFKKDPKNHGKILMSGLWKYSRHPNYFGELTMWWGIFIIVMGAGVPLISILGPIMITFLITKVSGIPMLEKHYEGNEDFNEYKKKTSVLIPWFVKN